MVKNRLRSTTISFFFPLGSCIRFVITVVYVDPKICFGFVYMNFFLYIRTGTGTYIVYSNKGKIWTLKYSYD
jgi:hypothetical protein